jgi:hypothetical protein
VFKEDIQVVSSLVKKGSFTKIELSNSIDKTKRVFSVDINPFLIDTKHKRKLKVAVAYDENTTKNYELVKNEIGVYQLKDTLPLNKDIIQLSFETKNKRKLSKKIVVNKDYVAIQFFPESGVLVNDISSKVGVKAVGFSGQGKKVKGIIVDETDAFVTLFATNHLGMGSFGISKVSSDKKYFAKIVNDETQIIKKVALPKVERIGNVLSLIKESERILVSIESNYLTSEEVGLKVICRGVQYFDIKVKLLDGKKQIFIPINSLPEGVVDFVLSRSDKRPLAERLYFNERINSRLDIAIKTDKKNYRQRDMVDVDVQTKNSKGAFVKANYSMLVVDDGLKGAIQDSRKSILSYFLLSSDLKGVIETPGFYFGSSKKKHNHLDALMLTQGWRKYKFKEPLSNQILEFTNEKHLGISGLVKSKIFGRKRKNIGVGMMTFEGRKIFQTQKTKEDGTFKFLLPDIFKDSIRVLFQTTKWSEKSNKYKVSIEPLFSPKNSLNLEKSSNEYNNVYKEFRKEIVKKEKEVKKFELGKGVVSLKEVMINAYKMTPNRRIVAESFGSPDIVISGKDILKKEKKWSTGLFSVLLESFPNINIERDTIGDLYIDIPTSDFTHLILDGEVVERDQYPYVATISSDQVSSVELIEQIQQYNDLFLDKFSDLSFSEIGGKIPVNESVVAIYTKAGVGFKGVNKPKGMYEKSIPVFAAKKEFYTPLNSNLKPDDWLKPDRRSLVYWNPNLESSKEGRFSTLFFNSDLVGDVKIIIEAISEKGELGYKELIYSVDKR